MIHSIKELATLLEQKNTIENKNKKVKNKVLDLNTISGRIMAFAIVNIVERNLDSITLSELIKIDDVVDYIQWNEDTPYGHKLSFANAVLTNHSTQEPVDHNNFFIKNNILKRKNGISFSLSSVGKNYPHYDHISNIINKASKLKITSLKKEIEENEQI